MSETFVPSSEDHEKMILVEFCKGTSCRQKCIAAIAALAGQHSLSVDDVLNGKTVMPIAGREVSVRTIGCLGACGKNPSARVNRELYFRASSPEAVEEALSRHLSAESRARSSS